jgi:hypothetical protein
MPISFPLSLSLSLLRGAATAAAAAAVAVHDVKNLKADCSSNIVIGRRRGIRRKNMI